MAISVVQSSSIEILLEALKRQVHQPKDNLFELFGKQHFIVPNKSVEKWLTNSFSKDFGLMANFEFHGRIQSFQWNLYKSVNKNKDLVRQASMPKFIIKWRIYSALKSFVANPTNNLDADHDLFGLINTVYENAKNIKEESEALIKRQQMLYWISDNTSKLITNYIEYRGHCDKHTHDACHCSQNWIARWSKNEPVDVEKHLNKKSSELDVINLQKAKDIESWQRWLWVNVFEIDYQLFKQVDAEFWEALENSQTREVALKCMPSTLSVFTVLELPPSQLNFLRRIGRYIDVVIYHYNPSQEYWADSVDPRWKNQIDLRIKERYVAQCEKKGYSPSDQEIKNFFNAYTLNFDAELRESRHPLLTRLGKQARDTFSLLSTLSSGEEGAWFDLFFDEEKNTLLGKLQSDVLHLLEPQSGSFSFQESDESIQINVCHSSLRQLEVLKEQLIYWLSQGSADNPRHPEDILVLTPNIKSAEPVIRSVFSPVPKASKTTDVYLPVKITGVAQVNLTNAWKSVLGRINLCNGRFQFDEFADWLSLSSTQKLYGLNFKDVERMITLLKDSKFKRGFDQDHISLFLDAGDDDYRFTLKYAIDRLVLGVALNQHAYHDSVLSYDAVRVEDFSLIGKLVKIFSDLNERKPWLHIDENEKNPEQWFEIILNDINDYMVAGETNLEVVLAVVQNFRRTLSVNRYRDFNASRSVSNLIRLHLPLGCLLDEISKGIDERMESAEPSGQVTFAQIGYIRPIPYKLVVMLNMDNGIFPDQVRQTPFDLMGLLRTQIGDRSRLDDEQGAFLDSLLLCKEAFWIFYNGFDLDGGHKRPPSLVVSELVDHLGLITRPVENMVTDYVEHKSVEVVEHLKSIYKVHPLQPFEISGFDGETPRFKNHWFRVGDILQNNPTDAIGWSLGEYVFARGVEKTVMAGSRWISDMIFPADLYLNSLGIRNITPLDIVPDNEPLTLSGLDKYNVRSFLVQHETDNLDMLSDMLPVGKLKNSAWAVSIAEYHSITNRLKNYSEKPTDTKGVTYDIAHNLSLNIVVPEDDCETEWVSLKTSASYADHRAKAWLEYLLWLAYLDLKGEGADRRMIIVFNNKTIEQKGLTSHQAIEMLSYWVEAWNYGKSKPLVLPAKLLLSALEKNKALSWNYCEFTQAFKIVDMEKLIKEWTLTYESNPDFPLTENKACRKHRDWQFILRDCDSELLLEESCNAFSYKLYHPIYGFQKTLED